MKFVLFLAGVVIFSGCASKKETSSEAQKKLETRYEELIGSATKADLVSDFGSPEWCRQKDSGDESCRFYLKKGTKWLGDKKERKHYDAFNEILADFDGRGVLKSFKANAQR